MRFREFFVAKGSNESEADRLSAELEEAYPWMDFTDEISESLGEELLASDGDSSWRKVASAGELIDWYNAQVRRGGSPSSDDAYVDLCAVVGRFGKIDAFGDGDFWVVEDSLAGLTASIISFSSTPLPAHMRNALSEWKSRHPNFASVSVFDEDGEVKLRV